LYKSEKAKRRQHDAMWILRKAAGLPVKTFGEDVSYLLMLLTPSNRRMDGDNCVKALQDCLQMSGIIEDDAQVKDHRVILAKGTPARTILYLWADSRLPAEDVERIAAGY
jgi:Holliday junction resolvase RusA-like endonuclease